MLAVAVSEFWFARLSCMHVNTVHSLFRALLAGEHLALAFVSSRAVTHLASQLRTSCAVPAALLVYLMLVYHLNFPGILLEYEHRDGTQGMKEIDLLQLTPECVHAVLLPPVHFPPLF